MQPLNPLPRLTRSASLLAAIAFASSLGLAQQTAPTAKDDTTPDKDKVVELEKFTVKAGFSGSLAAAAEAKQNSQNIVEVIMSEDIGKLPDVSIADSLTRLTGLATQRTNGRSQQISIRGLTGDFSTAMLNGREQVSTSLNRGVEFDQYPAELLNSVVVYKTAAADLTGQGLAGTIDLQTVQPLSKTGRTIAVSGYYQTTQLGQLTPGAKKDGNRFNVAYIDQFDDGKLGIALGYSHTDTPFEGQQFQAWGYATDAAGNFALGGTKSYVRTSNLKRDGIMGVIEYKPNSFVHSTIDFYSSKFDEKQLLRGMEIPLWPGWGTGTTETAYTATNGYLSSSTYTGAHPNIRNDTFQRKDDLYAGGWNLKFGDGTGWTTIFDMGFSKVTRSDENLETWSGLGYHRSDAGDTMTIQLFPGAVPKITTGLDYTNASQFFLTDPEGWGNSPTPGVAGPGYLKYFRSKDELGQLKLLTKHELKNFFSNMEFGVSYSDRYKRDGEGPSGWVYLTDGKSQDPYPPVIGITDMSFLGIKGIAAYNPQALVDNGTLSFYPNNDTGIVANRWQVTEKITRPYVQFDIDHKINGMPLTGNVGLQVINVDQSSKGYSANGNTLTPVTDGAKYTDAAPSLNLNFMPAELTYIRFSVARQIARPRMYDMRASRTWSYNSTNAGMTDLKNSPWSGDGGNPQLKPWKSDSIDLAFDKYFKGNKGYVSLALFDKKLLNYIYEQTALQDFTGYPVLTGPAPTLTQGPTSHPVNGQGGSIKGLEFTLSLASELISPAFKGFGLVMGGAYTDSNVEPWGPGNGTAPISGLSRKVANVTFYYEHKGFSARISERYRSDYRAYITTFGVPNFKGDVHPNGDFAVTQPEKVVDAQVGYTMQSGQLKGLSFYLQAYNLNNEPLITFNSGDPRQVINYQKYGASYSFGASYKF
ncbi:TonB-dependent receptor [Opitutus sp. GAS368]|jgi:iron complex outermembrane receptor protein|uniref:TonB-dependent receptor n=1 Tax=Opitutus sp. GAS368 TaxID=1882749 RepID=UPI00087A7E61|nr:TonB-dependent receptor [Opitutus sp. GAS368]SDR96684.1 iron complex outermembrane recepter protein [Opitutus sp. GAS368]